MIPYLLRKLGLAVPLLAVLLMMSTNVEAQTGYCDDAGARARLSHFRLLLSIALCEGKANEMVPFLLQ